MGDWGLGIGPAGNEAHCRKTLPRSQRARPGKAKRGPA